MALDAHPWLAEAARTLAAMRDAMPNAILIHGAPGTGLYELALDFSKSLFCLEPGPGGEPCGRCTGCRLTAAGTHPDFRQVLSEAQCAQRGVPYEAAENERSDSKKRLSREIRIHQIRALGDFLALNSNQGGRRIVLVYPADKVRAEAAASLLKSMEEPPEGLTWILVAEKIDDVLPTIRSRSRLVRVPMPQHDEALAFLRAKRVRNAEAALAMAGGAPLSALEAPEDERLAPKAESAVLGFLRAGADLDVDALVRMSASDLAVPAFSLLMLRWSHDLMRATLGLGPRYFVDEAETIRALADRTDAKRATGLCRAAQECRRAADHPLSARQVVESALLGYRDIFR